MVDAWPTGRPGAGSAFIPTDCDTVRPGAPWSCGGMGRAGQWPPRTYACRGTRAELLARCLHICANHAGGFGRAGAATWVTEDCHRTPVRVPAGKAWILTEDEDSVRASAGERAADRRRLSPVAGGGLGVDGAGGQPAARVVDASGMAGRTVAGRRRGKDVVAGRPDPRRHLRPRACGAVMAEAAGLPRNGLAGRLALRWEA